MPTVYVAPHHNRLLTSTHWPDSQDAKAVNTRTTYAERGQNVSDLLLPVAMGRIYVSFLQHSCCIATRSKDVLLPPTPTANAGGKLAFHMNTLPVRSMTVSASMSASPPFLSLPPTRGTCAS